MSALQDAARALREANREAEEREQVIARAEAAYRDAVRDNEVLLRNARRRAGEAHAALLRAAAEDQP